jgi:hypothetical protein
VIQLMLPLHECSTEPLQDVVVSVADPAAAESATEPLHVVADAIPTETYCLCVRV